MSDHALVTGTVPVAVWEAELGEGTMRTSWKKDAEAWAEVMA